MNADQIHTQALQDVIAERRRQIESEGWTTDHDDQHLDGAMSQAAACYASAASAGLKERTPADVYGRVADSGRYWPWQKKWWKPTSPRRDLVKAAALIVAEIERIDRASNNRI